MIEQRLVDFIHAAPWFTLGTRDAKLHPHGCFLMGGRMDATKGLLSVFLPEALGGRTIPDLRETRIAAVNLGEEVHHESYQLKGEVVDLHPITEAEAAVMGVFVPKMVTATAAFGVPVQDWKFPPLQPALTIAIRVTDVYVQTPGPGAGTRIGP